MEGDMINTLADAFVDYAGPFCERAGEVFDEASVLITWAGVFLKFAPYVISAYVVAKTVAEKTGKFDCIKKLGGFAVDLVKSGYSKTKEKWGRIESELITGGKGLNDDSQKNGGKYSLEAEANEPSIETVVIPQLPHQEINEVKLDTDRISNEQTIDFVPMAKSCLEISVPTNNLVSVLGR